MTWLWAWFRLRKIELEVTAFRRILRSRTVMRFYRRFPRLAWLPPGRLIVHHADAVDALEHGRRFGMPYLAKMEELGGPFVLGLDDGPEHARLRAAVEAAIQGCRFDELYDDSRRRAEELLAGRNRIEVVRGLTDPVLATTIGRHLGLGPVTIDQLVDGRAVFRDIFINGLKDPRVSRRARDAADRLRLQVSAVVDDRRKHPHERDILGRLIMHGGLTRKQEIDHGIGLLVAWSASVSRAMAFALDALFKEPDGFALAQQAALRADRGAMASVLWEAFRFVPPAPAVERVCRREAPLRGWLVRREADIIVTFTSAMMDAEAIPDPGRFRAGRCPQKDLTFGYGRHLCLGRDLAREQMTAMLISLFRRRNLKWAYGIKLEGPYPHRLEVTW